jgi:quercetin dioxygenase-like cupin family protein
MKNTAAHWLAGMVMAGALAGAMPGSMPGSMAAEVTGEPKRTVLLRQDLDIPGREVVMVLVEIPPGVAEGLHTHPAELFAFVVAGEMAIEVAGQPTKALKAGDTFHVPAGSIHRGVNRGTTTVKLSTVFVAQKGKPLSVPAP